MQVKPSMQEPADGAPDENSGASTPQIDALTCDAQILTFIIGSEEYGIDILQVQGIQGWGKVTVIPNSPDFLLGVINLRGAIVPIIDLRIRFNQNKVDYDDTTVVIVVKAIVGDKEKTIGLVVDAVSEVYDVDESKISATPNISSKISKEFTRGILTVGQIMVILLDIDVLAAEGLFKHISTELLPN